MRNREFKHIWPILPALLLACSVSFAFIQSNVSIPSISNLMSNSNPEPDSLKTTTNSSTNDSIQLPYKFNDKDDLPYEDLETPSGFRLGPPPSLKTEITYNPETGEYDVHEKMGAFENNTPYSLSQQEYFDYNSKKMKNDYWHEKASNDAGKNSNSQGGLFSGNMIDNMLGDKSPIEIKPQGSLELTLGGKYSKTYNPSLTRKQQSMFNFDFSNKIQINVTGKIGDRVSMKIKYDTESQFDFENEMKLDYTGDEDEIIKKIEAGDVSFPLDNSLIKGSQSLKGFKTELQFGKLFVTSVLSRQRGEFSTINVDKGAQMQQFSIRSDNYETNKHFFIGHYFRDHYEDAFKTMPEITNGVLIRKVEIWVTQTSTGKENARNIIALTDLGDVKSGGAYTFPSNQSDNLYQEIKNTAGIRNISDVSTIMNSKGYKVGKDYEKIELAVKLKENQYTINNKLGYISLKSSIDPSKVLAIAYEYEFRGKVYQVGEFSSDGVEHPGALIVKLLKGSQLNPRYNNWDLMMKNVYSLGGYQMSADDFKLEILYEDDRSGKPIGYIPEGKIKGKPLLSIMNLDTISSNKEPYPDGIFDFIDGFTINSQSGLVIFPVLEPFGSHLAKQIDDPKISSKYVYNELYDSTQSTARQTAEKNKFLIKGSYKSSFSSDISLNATQVQEGSVTVTAGGRTLVEGTDYTVDYAMGRVKIINQGLIESQTPIKVSLESNPLFSMRSKNMMGTRLDYRFNENFHLGATVLRLSEVPLSTKVGFEDFPINNTIYGFDGAYSTDAPIITRMVDKIPFINTKEKSSIKVSAEFAQLVPSVSKLINQAVEIDYFENAEQKISLREPSLWVLASTPQGQPKLFPEGNLINNRNYGLNRAQLAWFDINTDYFYGYSSPVSKTLQSNIFSHPVMATDLFPNKQSDSYYERPLTMINLAYYPYERGPYNYDVEGVPSISKGIDPQTGRLNAPEKRWAGIMREMTTTDFEEANIEYIQFWLMDPFKTDTSHVNKGGDLYFDLGMISEDILRDSRKFAENGLKTDTANYTFTKWGRIPNFQVIEKGFDNNVNRADQDVGFDGLANQDENIFFGDYLEKLKSYNVNPAVLSSIEEDPSKDDFKSYLDTRGEDNMSIFERYRYYNGTENNSPVGNKQGTGRLSPDVEDINEDNTLQESESYFQYKISIRPDDMEVGKNFIVDKITENAKLTNNEKVNINWYQFKIPVTTEMKQRIGDISDFKSIQFMRMFLTNFKDSIYLRMAEMALVRSNWRKYDNLIYEPGEYDLNNNAQLDISSINFEENNERSPVNYILPPGVERTIDPMNTLMTQENESSLMMKVVDLDDGNAKAIYKMLNRDLRQFGQLNMFVHAEALPEEESQIKDGDVSIFMRLGSDYTQNYYEYEIPLTLTKHLPAGVYYQNGNVNSADRLKVWPSENNFEIDLSELVKIKETRDTASTDLTQIFSVADGNNKISVKGSPNLANVKTIMIGVKNRRKSSLNPNDDGMQKSIIVWVDELRLTDFNDKGGWAATASTRINMADFATLSVDGKIIKPGFGGVDERIFERSQEDVRQLNMASNVALHKFFPEKLGLQLPFYVGWSQLSSTPLYDPLDPDVLLKTKLENLNADSAQSYKELSQDYESRLSYNFTNVRINKAKPKFLHPLHVNNFSMTYAFNKIHNRNVEYEYEDRYDNKFSLLYNYTIRSKNYEPFKFIKSQSLALIRDFNFSILPNQITVDNQLNKTYKESVRRNLSQYADPDYKFTPVYAKMFDWTRAYNVKYNLTKNLKLDYSANNSARVEEPLGKIYHDDDHDAYMRRYRDSVINELQNGGKTTDFNQRLDITYKLPVDKLPFFNFISSNYRYGGNYSWTRGYEIPNQEEMLNAGNIIKNSNTQNFDATISLSKLYNKSKYLKNVDKKFSTRGKGKPKTESVKYTKDGINIRAFEAVEIKHGLKTTDVKLSITDSKGKVIEGKTIVVDGNKILFTAEKDYENAQANVTGKREVKDPAWRDIVDGVVHTLIMVKSVSFTNAQNNGSYIPGYKENTKNFGLNDAFASTPKPGWAYAFGYVPSFDDLKSTILDNNWLIANDSLLNDKFTRTYSNQMHLKTTVEPFYNFKINFDNDRTFSQNQTQYVSNNPISMADSKRTTNGSFTITTNALASNGFFKSGASDKTYQLFKENRIIIAKRLAAIRGETYEVDPTTGFPSYFKSSSQDVLIPAFLSAYTGQDPNKMYIKDNFTPLFRNVKDFIRSLNWRINYNGLSDVKYFKKNFKSITISHGYACTYSISNYTTFTSDNMVNSDFYADLVDGSVYLAPEYSINAVSIDERFNPLIGIDTKLQNNITAKAEVKNNRSVSMSLVNTEISETGGFEYVFGIGYVIKDFTVNIKTSGSSKSYTNDINTRIDISVRDNNTIRRTISDDVKSVISGQKIWSIKWFADYQLTQQVTIRTFCDWTLNQPRTNGYKTTNTNFGVNLRLSLM